MIEFIKLTIALTLIKTIGYGIMVYIWIAVFERDLLWIRKYLCCDSWVVTTEEDK